VHGAGRPIRISIVATPDAMVSPTSGLFEVLSSVAATAASAGGPEAGDEPLRPEIVAERPGPLRGASGLSITAHRAFSEVTATDVVVVPSVAMGYDGSWVPGRYPQVVRWIRAMHAGGAAICSSCSGGMLTAETGLLDRHEATVHWLSEADVRRRHPEIRLRPDEALVVSGDGGRLVTSGASTAWHDLALYLVARFVGPASAQALARYQLMQWHREGQTAFHVFHPATGHGDAVVLASQRWIDEHHATAGPVDAMIQRSGLPASTFTRRFRTATGHGPIGYVQRIRVEHAKRQLETTGEPIERVSWAVGYEDPAAFRRVFRRLVGMAPGEYRRRFRLPELGPTSD
jgi:transcriptional regulator GlxA family with amidase domain